MSFELEKKTYDRRYLLLLPFRCAPLCTVGTLFQKFITGIVCTLWIPVEAGFIDKAADCAAGGAEWRELLPFLAAMLLMIVWKRMGYSFGRFLTMKGEKATFYQLQNAIVKKCSRVSYRILEERRFQELKYSLLDSGQSIVWTMVQQTGNFMQYMMRMAGVCLFLGMENRWLGILVLGALLPFLCFSFRKRRQLRWERQQKRIELGRKCEYLGMVITGRYAQEERSFYSYIDFIQEKWKKKYRKLFLVEKSISKQFVIQDTAEAIILGTVFFLVAVCRVSFLLNGWISLGVFIALSRGVYDMTVFLYNGVDMTVPHMADSRNFLEDLTNFATMPETEGTNELPSEKAEECKELEFRHVSFRYPRTARYILKDLNMTMKSGGRYAFVGENGAGKTTVAKLLTGVYDSYEGSILLNGIELRDYAPERRKAMFAAIYQDSARYDGTVVVNILLGDVRHMEETGQRERMEVATKASGAYDNICALPEGFDTLLGKKAMDGVELSDGQWQRIMMARLLMSPAPFYILDEPAAAIDPVAESLLYEKFAEISRGKTTLSISHRLGSTKGADRIFVLKNGTVAEEGSHGELMEKKGVYAKMFEEQREWYIE